MFTLAGGMTALTPLDAFGAFAFLRGLPMFPFVAYATNGT